MNKLIPDKLYESLLTLPRFKKQLLVIFVDSILLILGVWLAYSLRLGSFFVPSPSQWLLMSLAPVIAMPVFLKLGLYRAVIRYVGEQAFWAILKGMSLTALAWSALAFMTQMTGAQGVPRTVPWIFWLIGVVAICGSRFIARSIFSAAGTKKNAKRPVLIYGAGEAGRQLVASLRRGHELSPIAFIDDDISLQGKEIDGLRVYSNENLNSLISRFGICDVIVTLPSASNARRKEIVSFLEQFSVKVRILPSISSIADGRHLVNLIREVDIEDLLGRDPVTADPVLLSQCIKDKAVLVTGAGGSIGSELCRQILAIGPSKLVLLESNEGSLFNIHRELAALTPIEIIPCLGSITNRRIVATVLREHQIQTIYHAAAHKHVPLIEANLFEGIRNNVLGTLNLAQIAFTSKVETFVLISTDKAVRPSSVMGATKRCAELIIQNLNQQAILNSTGQRFCAVRFGNVLGSSGSVVPIFKEQIAHGGPITVTHSEVTRYFMSIHEAVELVIQAGSMAKGGEIFLLDMGEPVKILDLALKMVKLAGLSLRTPENVSGDIEIVTTGLRPGEKLYEELLIASEGAEGTSHPKILKGSEPELPESELYKLINLLRAGILYRNPLLVREALFNLTELSDKPRPGSISSFQGSDIIQ